MATKKSKSRLERRIKEWENISGSYITPTRKRTAFRMEFRRPGSNNPRKR